jgi:hypothetical protein
MVAVFAAMLLIGLSVEYTFEPRPQRRSFTADQEFVPAVGANDWSGAFRHPR